MDQKPFVFKLVEYDEWGNPILLCPVCKFPFKKDGIRKHILRKCQENDQKHREWYIDNAWETGSPVFHTKEEHGW